MNTCMCLCREGGKYWDILNTYWVIVLNPATNSVNAHVLLIDFLPHNPNFAAKNFGLVSPASYGFREFISVFTNCPFRLYPEPDELFPPSHPYRYYCVRPVHIPDAPHSNSTSFSFSGVVPRNTFTSDIVTEFQNVEILFLVWERRCDLFSVSNRRIISCRLTGTDCSVFLQLPSPPADRALKLCKYEYESRLYWIIILQHSCLHFFFFKMVQNWQKAMLRTVYVVLLKSGSRSNYSIVE